MAEATEVLPNFAANQNGPTQAGRPVRFLAFLPQAGAFAANENFLQIYPRPNLSKRNFIRHTRTREVHNEVLMLPHRIAESA